MIQADGDVLCAGSAAEVFGDADRAVLCLERGGTPAGEILLIRTRRRLHALVNECPHLGRVLDDARVRGDVLTCRGHGRSYSLRSGRRTGTLSWGGPAELRRVRAWDENGQLFIAIRDAVA